MKAPYRTKKTFYKNLLTPLQKICITYPIATDFCDSLPSGCYETMSLHRLLKRKDTDW
jgi:hypothetical protein